MGITGQLWNWFRDYLSNRQHYVHIEGSSSDKLPVLSGVPQGSILGPVLFIVYINGIPDVIHHSLIFTFADDTKFLKHISDYNDHLLMQEDMVYFETEASCYCTLLKINLPPILAIPLI